VSDKGRGILGNPNATGEEIRHAMGVAIHRALREHKRAGNPVATWDWDRNEVRIIQPEDLEIPDDDDEAGAPREAGPII
jgi:hypothetical protein